MIIDTTQRAMHYLVQHGYQRLGNDGINRVFFKKESGDRTWEERVALENGWEVLQKDRCCLLNEERSKRNRYCGKCGAGINDMASYIHFQEKSKPPKRFSAEASISR